MSADDYDYFIERIVLALLAPVELMIAELNRNKTPFSVCFSSLLIS
jgi:hypothetical protein